MPDFVHCIGSSAITMIDKFAQNPCPTQSELCAILKVPIDPEFNAEPVESETRAELRGGCTCLTLICHGCRAYINLGLFNRSAHRRKHYPELPALDWNCHNHLPDGSLELSRSQVRIQLGQRIGIYIVWLLGFFVFEFASSLGVVSRLLAVADLIFN